MLGTLYYLFLIPGLLSSTALTLLAGRVNYMDNEYSIIFLWKTLCPGIHITVLRPNHRQRHSW